MVMAIIRMMSMKVISKETIVFTACSSFVVSGI